MSKTKINLAALVPKLHNYEICAWGEGYQYFKSNKFPKQLNINNTVVYKIVIYKDDFVYTLTPEKGFTEELFDMLDDTICLIAAYPVRYELDLRLLHNLGLSKEVIDNEEVIVNIKPI